MRARLILMSVLLSTLAGPALASVLIRVDKATQRMEVSVDGAPAYDWPVSTGVAAHDTPVVSARPQRLSRDHRSKEWDDAPMPFSIFFTDQGHAIHGSGHTRQLGRPASHGCVRLSVKNAETLFELVKAQGSANTRIVVEGEIPKPSPAVVKRAPRKPTFDPYADDYDDAYRVPARMAPRRQVPDRWDPYGNGYRVPYGQGFYDMSDDYYDGY